MHQRPPFLLHILALLFVITFLINVSGLSQVLRSWNWLLVAGYYPPPIYVVLKDVFFALASLIAAVVLWMRLPLAPLYCQVVAGLTFAWFWVERLLLTSNPLPLRSQWFTILLSLLLLGFTMVSSYLMEDFMRPTTSIASFGDDAGKENESIIP